MPHLRQDTTQATYLRTTHLILSSSEGSFSHKLGLEHVSGLAEWWLDEAAKAPESRPRWCCGSSGSSPGNGPDRCRAANEFLQAGGCIHCNEHRLQCVCVCVCVTAGSSTLLFTPVWGSASEQSHVCICAFTMMVKAYAAVMKAQMHTRDCSYAIMLWL